MKKSSDGLESGGQSLTRELNGYVELGMKREVLTLAGDCLRRRPLEAKIFDAALSALLLQADDLKPWIGPVSSAYFRLRQADRASARFLMLGFCSAIGHYKFAATCLPRHFTGPHRLGEMAFAMDSLLKLGMLEQAGRLTKKCRRGCRQTKDTAIRGMLLATLAEYSLRIGEWNEALRLCDELQQNESFAENGAILAVEIQLARAMKATQTGLETLAALRKNFDPKMEIMLPGNHAARWEGAETKLKQLLGRIEQVLPTERWREFGLTQTAGDSIRL